MTQTVVSKRFQQSIDFTICKSNIKTEIKKVLKRVFPETATSSSRDSYDLKYPLGPKTSSKHFLNPPTDASKSSFNKAQGNCRQSHSEKGFKTVPGIVER